jgi:hypothetical protein
MRLAVLLRGHPPRVRHPRPLAKRPWAPTPIIFWVIANDLVMANDLDDLDGAEGGPQPAEGRKLVIIDLRHPTIMPPPWEHRAAARTNKHPGRGGDRSAGVLVSMSLRMPIRRN